MRLLWPTKGAAVVVLRPVTEENLARAIRAFTKRVGHAPRTLVMTFRGAKQLLSRAARRRYRVFGTPVSFMTIQPPGCRRAIGVEVDEVLPTGWVLLKR